MAANRYAYTNTWKIHLFYSLIFTLYSVSSVSIDYNTRSRFERISMQFQGITYVIPDSSFTMSVSLAESLTWYVDILSPGEESHGLPHACWRCHPQSKLKVAAGLCGLAAEELSRERELKSFGGRISYHLHIDADFLICCSHHAALGLVWCFYVKGSHCFLFFFQQKCMEGLSAMCQGHENITESKAKTPSTSSSTPRWGNR